MDDATRLHVALCGITKRLVDVIDDARFELRLGYWLVNVPSFPVPSFNGVWAETDAAEMELESVLREIEQMGLPFGAIVRANRTLAVEAAARRLGLTQAERVPGMAVTQSELTRKAVKGLEIIPVETASTRAQALAVAAAGFEVPAELLGTMYLREVAEIEGTTYYLARHHGNNVATAIGCEIDGTVGIFNVATPPEQRRRGYGAAVTARVAHDAFTAGADLAWLQSSGVGESVYTSLGFREVETYTVFTRPHDPPRTS